MASSKSPRGRRRVGMNRYDSITFVATPESVQDTTGLDGSVARSRPRSGIRPIAVRVWWNRSQSCEVVHSVPMLSTCI